MCVRTRRVVEETHLPELPWVALCSELQVPQNAPRRATRGTLVSRQPQEHAADGTCPPRRVEAAPVGRSDTEIAGAIRALKTGKAPGPDGVHAEFLTHLGKTATEWVYRLLRRSLHTGRVPAAWRRSVVIPLLKPHKDPEDVRSYRPVSLTSVLCKLAERVVHQRLLHSTRGKLEDRQFGYLSTRSTLDVVHGVCEAALRGLNVSYQTRREGNRHVMLRQRAAALMVDFTAAFDKVNHRILLQRLRALGVESSERRWVRNFLTDRTATVRVNDCCDHSFRQRRGVPQGTILGPLLFVIYVDALLRELREARVAAWMYADDLTIVTTGPVTTCGDEMQRACEVITGWCAANDMSVSAKTEGIIFTSSTRDRSTFTVTCGGHEIVLCAHTPDGVPSAKRLLGIWLDPMLTFSQHIGSVLPRAKKRVAALRRWAGAKFGPSTHSLRTFYKGLVESLLLYGCEVWMHRISPTLREALEVVQRAALRAVTGCVSSTKQDLLYLEANTDVLRDVCTSRSVYWNERCCRFSVDDTRTALRQQDCRRDLSREHPPITTLTECANAIRSRGPLRQVPTEQELQLLFSPARTEALSRVTFGVDCDIIVPPLVLPPGISGELAAPYERDHKQRRWWSNLATLTRLRTSFPWSSSVRPRSVVEAWTDASVRNDHRGIGASALYFGTNDDSCPTQIRVTDLSEFTCSFRSEALAIELGIRQMREEALQMTPCRRRRASFMLYTDSRSTISMLATGPSSQHEAIGHRIWHELWLSARAGMHVHLQFVYSHSGTARNELADWAASRAFARPPGAAPSWWKDAARWTTYSEGKVPLAPIPTCPGPRTLLPDAHRSTSVRWARIRTQETMEFGMLPRRLGFIRDAACRWCCGGVFAIRAHEVPPAPRPRSTDPIQCPSCGVTLANLKSLRTHWQSRHPADELPEHLRSRSTPGPLLHGPPQAGWLRCRWCQYLHPAAHEAQCPRRGAHEQADGLVRCPHCAQDRPAGHVQRCPAREDAVAAADEPLFPCSGPEETLAHVCLYCPALAHLQPGWLDSEDTLITTVTNEVPQLLTFLNLAQQQLPPHLRF
eukprot:PhM_4_TR2092/c0_g1_i8/m.29369